MTVSRVKLLGNYIGQTILTFISILGIIIDLGGNSHYVWLQGGYRCIPASILRYLICKQHSVNILLNYVRRVIGRQKRTIDRVNAGSNINYEY